MSAKETRAPNEDRATENAWFWRRLEKANADFEALPEWMKRKDFVGKAEPARRAKTLSQRGGVAA